VRYDDLVAHTGPRRLALLIVIAAGAGVAAFEPAPGPEAIAEAIRIGQSRVESTRIRYHQPYRLEIGRAPVDSIDLVTPFRSVVLAAEARASQAGRLGQREALAVLGEQQGQLLVFVELTFHPLNVYVGVPPYVVALERQGEPDRVTALALQRIPRFGPRVGGAPLPSPAAPALPPGGQPLLGGTVIARFDGARLDPGATYDVMIEENGKTLARSAVNLASLR
jgi:hypothetical protein